MANNNLTQSNQDCILKNSDRSKLIECNVRASALLDRIESKLINIIEDCQKLATDQQTTSDILLGLKSN